MHTKMSLRTSSVKHLYFEMKFEIRLEIHPLKGMSSEI
jgi:hypothetical protein